MKSSNKNIHFSIRNEELTFKRTFSHEAIDCDDETKQLFHKSKSYSQINRIDSDQGFNSSLKRINTPLPCDFEEDLSVKSKKEHKIFRFKINFSSIIPREHIVSLSNFWYKYSKYLIYLKHVILLTYCLGCVIILSLNNDSESSQFIQTVVSRSNQLSCLSHDRNSSKVSGKFYRFELNGPFVDVKDKNSFNDLSGSFIKIDVFQKNKTKLLSSWTLLVANPYENTENVFKEDFKSIKDFELKESFNQDDLIFNVNTNNLDSISFNYNCFQLYF